MRRGENGGMRCYFSSRNPNKSAVSALQQIKDRKYPDSIQDYTGDILLVGINYSKKDKKHKCVIEAYKKK